MKQYSFYNVDFLVDGVRVEGYPTANSILTAERLTPQHQGIIDAYGKMAVATMSDLSGVFSFPLLQTADWNETLYEKAQLTQATGLSGNKSLWVPMQLQIVDKMGNMIANGTNAFIIKQPKMVRGTGFNSNVWQLMCERVSYVSGTYTEVGN